MGAPKLNYQDPAADSSLNLVDNKLDHVLQKIVEEAQQLSGFPIALVSLVMDQIQFFKAQVGLPPDLAASQATDRCSSFCQFVVETKKPFFIEDSLLHPELPKELITLYNIRAYSGFPITVHGEVVGSLCLIDVKANSIPETAKTRMAELALLTGHHLQSLKKGHSSELILLEKASTPVMSEIRNILQSMTLSSGQATQLAQQVNPIFFLLEQYSQKKVSSEELLRALEALQETIKTYRRIPTLLQLIGNSVTRMTGAYQGLQEALSLKTGTASCLVADIIKPSESLSHHFTKLIGGVSWISIDEPCQLKVPQSFAITLLGSALSSIAESVLRTKLNIQGIQGSFEKIDDQLRMHLTVAGLPSFEWVTLQSILSILVSNSDTVAIESTDKSLVINWQTAE